MIHLIPDLSNMLMQRCDLPSSKDTKVDRDLGPTPDGETFCRAGVDRGRMCSHITNFYKHIGVVLTVVLLGVTPVGADEISLETLMKTQLEGVEGREVIVSKVYIPANSTLPKHWHPGEEFVYILEGSVTLWQKGKDNVTGNMGDVMKVPLEQVHTAVTGAEGVSLLIFRVHETGKPERVKAE